MIRSFIFICVALFLTLDSLQATAKKTVCLNMIVKDESQVICRCLASVLPLIDYWVIVDTGSSDKTQDIIKDFMKNIPGELHERPWVNFEHNRNQALELAKGKSDYVLFIDADEVLALEENFSLPELDKDFYFIMTEFSGTKYGRVQLINNHLNWKWIGVLHEAVDCPQARTNDTIAGVKNIVSCDGARSKDPQKYQKDAALLEQALLKEPKNSRYRFYLAQSYLDGGEYEKAIENYEKRIAMGGWSEEVFWSMYRIALAQELLDAPASIVTASYLRAHDFRPSRVEPLCRLAKYLRFAENYPAAYAIARQGLNIPVSNDILFVEHWMYDYDILLEFSIAAYWTERYTDALLASRLLLADSTLPANVRDCVNRNLHWIQLKLNEEKKVFPQILAEEQIKEKSTEKQAA